MAAKRAIGRWSAHGGQTSRRRVLRLGALGSAGALLAACGGGGGKESSSSSGSGPAASSSAAPGAGSAPVVATGQPKPGGTFSRHWRTNSVLDPTLSSQFSTQTLAGFTTARLLKFKTGPSPEVYANYESEPDLAETIEIAPDGLTVTLKLRAAKWQNIAPVSGRAVEAEDVRVSVERFRAEPKNSNRTAFGTPETRLLESVQAPDARTVVMKLAKPYGPFKNMLTNPNYLWILPKEAASGGYDPAKTVIGAGPFILDKFEPDIAFTLKRNPDYYGAPMPYVDSVKLVRIDQETQDIAQFQAGQLDYAEIRPNALDEVKRAVPKASYLEYLSSTFGFLAPQLRTETPYRDIRVRQALSHALDRDGILALVYEGKGAWNSAVPAHFGGWRIDPKSADFGEGSKYYKLDPAESRKLLAAAGHPNLAMRFVYTNNIYGNDFNRTAEAIAGWLKDGGFNPQIVTQDYQSQYINPTGTFYGGAFDHVFYGLQTGFPDPHDFLFNMYHTKGGRNHSGVNDPQLEAMIDKEGSTLDDKERVKQVKDIQRYLGTKLYYVPGAIGFQYLAHQEWIKNFHAANGSYGMGAETVAKLWVDKK